MATHTLLDLPPLAPDTSTRAASGGPKAKKASASTVAAKKAAAVAGGGGSGGEEGSGGCQAPVLLLIDTAGCGFEEEAEEEGDSKSNPGEAKVCWGGHQLLFTKKL